MKATASTKNVSRSKILVAEDDSVSRRRLTQLLANDYDVTSTRTSTEAMAAIRRDQPHLVILDLKTSKQDGLELLKKLRKANHDLNVIVITERSRTSDIPKALQLGATEYLVKPIDSNEFRERVSRAVAKILRRQISRQWPIKMWLPELHDPQTGRIAADRVAEYMAVPLKQLAQAAGANYTAVHKTPAADSLQSALIPVKRSLEILHELLGDRAAERAWLNSPHPDLGMRTPLQVILEGNGRALWTILENALEGIPS